MACTFQRIEGNVLPNIDPNELCTDQKHLLEMCQANTTGQCSSDLGNRKPEPICHSRWLTTANRILRWYVSKENPEKHLIILVHYIVKMYAPIGIWFEIKSKSSCTDGSRHLFRPMIHYSRYLSTEHQIHAESPIFQSFQSTQLEENIHTSYMLQLKSFPCHTQAVERVG